MIITAWNNGCHYKSGAGYGFHVGNDDWRKYFENEKGLLTIILPNDTSIVIEKPPADLSCHEFIHIDIGKWILEQSGKPPIEGKSPWERWNPPRYKMTPPKNGECIVSKSND